MLSIAEVLIESQTPVFHTHEHGVPGAWLTFQGQPYFLDAQALTVHKTAVFDTHGKVTGPFGDTLRQLFGDAIAAMDDDEEPPTKAWTVYTWQGKRCWVAWDAA